MPNSSTRRPGSWRSRRPGRREPPDTPSTLPRMRQDLEALQERVRLAREAAQATEAADAAAGGGPGLTRPTP